MQIQKTCYYQGDEANNNRREWKIVKMPIENHSRENLEIRGQTVRRIIADRINCSLFKKKIILDQDFFFQKIN